MDYLFFHGVSIIDFDQVFGHWKVCCFSAPLLTYFMPLVSFYTSRKHQKTYGFLMLSGDIEKEQGHEMG